MRSLYIEWILPCRGALYERVQSIRLYFMSNAGMAVHQYNIFKENTH